MVYVRGYYTISCDYGNSVLPLPNVNALYSLPCDFLFSAACYLLLVGKTQNEIMKLKKWTGQCGRITIGSDDDNSYWCIHILPQDKVNQFWGYKKDYYDRPYNLFGLGRLALIIW